MVHETEVSVRFSETDLLGHVNNTSYFIYLEEARIQFFEKLDASTHASEWNFILASTKCDFLAQAYFRQQLVIKTYVMKVGTKSFTLGHDIHDANTGQLVAKGEAVVVHFNFDSQQSEEIPEELKRNIECHIINA